MLQKLRETILAKKISGVELCRKAQVNEGTLSKFLSGKSSLSAENFESLAAAVGLDLVPSEQSSIFEDERVTHGRNAFATRDNAQFVADLIPSKPAIDAAALIADESGQTIQDVLTSSLRENCARVLAESGILPGMLKSGDDMLLSFYAIWRSAVEGRKGYRIISTCKGFIPCGPTEADKLRAEAWLSTVVQEVGEYVDREGRPSKTPRK